jgi:hypothetical protein
MENSEKFPLSSAELKKQLATYVLTNVAQSAFYGTVGIIANVPGWLVVSCAFVAVANYRMDKAKDIIVERQRQEQRDMRLSALHGDNVPNRDFQ